MKILITGICGFAGSTLSCALIERCEGLQICGFDNLSRKGSETNIESLRALGVNLHIGDLLDRDFLATLPPADFILDCAANPSVLAGVDGKTSSRGVIEQNLFGTVNLLELCKEWQVGFSLLSTSRVYSINDLLKIPLRVEDAAFLPERSVPAASVAGVTEDFSTAPPVSLYGATKIASELLALEYGEAFDFPVWINRCGVLAGAGQFGRADQGIFSYWIHSWRAQRPLRYIGFGGVGHQVRDCLHPRDIAPLLIQQFQSSSSSSQQPAIVNLSGGAKNSMSLAQLTRWCRSRLGPHPSFPDNAPAHGNASSRPYDIPWLVLDHTRATNSWQWSPAADLEAILEEIAAHAETHPHWLDSVS